MGIFMASEAEMRMHRCCFTGHRPEKLNGTESTIKLVLREQISCAIHDGLTVFITGMARGVDIWAAEIVLDLRKRNNEIKLICAIPHDGFADRWSPYWKQLYKHILNEADLTRVISNGYHTGVYQVRNEWMVNQADCIVAYVRVHYGGAYKSLLYAHKSKKTYINLYQGEYELY